jgi:hypothetical protein
MENKIKKAKQYSFIGKNKCHNLSNIKMGKNPKSKFLTGF